MCISRLVYVSEAAVEFDRPQLDELCRRAAEKNAQRQITGYLGYRQGRFVQYLEGEQAPLREVMQAITNDDRHRIVHVVELGQEQTRLFPSWSMRYVTADEIRSIQLDVVLKEFIVSMARTPPAVRDDERMARVALGICEKIARIVHTNV